MDAPTINLGLLVLLMLLSLVLAMVDFMLAIATLTMLKGVHIMYRSLGDEVKELKNSVTFLINLLQRNQ